MLGDVSQISCSAVKSLISYRAALLFAPLSFFRWRSRACSQTCFQIFIKSWKIIALRVTRKHIWRVSLTEAHRMTDTTVYRTSSLPVQKEDISSTLTLPSLASKRREGDGTSPAIRLRSALFTRVVFRAWFLPVFRGTLLQDSSEPRGFSGLILWQWSVGIALSPND